MQTINDRFKLEKKRETWQQRTNESVSKPNILSIFTKSHATQFYPLQIEITWTLQ